MDGIINENFDITIIGGGHAGLEAAWLASQYSLSVAIITIPGIPLASAPCNPAIGGVGKGQMVREIDALGGLMGQLADKAGIQFRTLNESKGYAVRSTRVQIDKERYAEYAEEFVAAKSNITVIRSKVKKVSQAQDGFQILIEEAKSITSKKVVVTTGTFLNGKMHTGEVVTNGGRVDCDPSPGMNDLFDSIETLPARFKTGTPARLKKESLDYDKMEIQESDPASFNFHCFNFESERSLPQVSCYLTRTNEDTLGTIRENKERSPIFNGQVEGVGPRYCPSIEDKAFRYPDRNSHHVFVEPEGLDLDTIYPSGISTSLPRDIQEDFIRSIPGLENAEIAVYGYAVEYDVVNTAKLDITLQYKDIPGLYFAGQVNGTSGYEEAAGQGLVAGLNAAQALLERKPIIFDRNDCYLGVLIEDLVSNVRDEPYRLFTARSENRLAIREDNAIPRMAAYREKMLLNFPLDNYIQEFFEQKELLAELIETTKFYPTQENKDFFHEVGLGPLNREISILELMKRPGLDPYLTFKRVLEKFGVKFHQAVLFNLAVDKKYEGYIARDIVESAKLRKLHKKSVNWEKLVTSGHIANECRQRIDVIRPDTFGQLSRIDGIRPATLAYVAGSLIR